MHLMSRIRESIKQLYLAADMLIAEIEDEGYDYDSDEYNYALEVIDSIENLFEVFRRP